MSSLQDKAKIRRKHLTRRATLTTYMQKNASIAICKRIESLTIYQNAKKVAFYQAIRGEVSLTPLFQQAEATHKMCYMPVIIPNQKTLIFLPTTSKTPLKENQFNIPEPAISHDNAIPIEQIDLMILPLVAFDKHGTRLGHGIGYYDRTLTHQKPACLLGAAYEFQQEPMLEKAPWDIPLTGIVTEKNTYWSNP